MCGSPLKSTGGEITVCRLREKDPEQGEMSGEGGGWAQGAPRLNDAQKVLFSHYLTLL